MSKPSQLFRGGASGGLAPFWSALRSTVGSFDGLLSNPRGTAAPPSPHAGLHSLGGQDEKPQHMHQVGTGGGVCSSGLCCPGEHHGSSQAASHAPEFHGTAGVLHHPNGIQARHFNVHGGPDTMKAAVLWEPNGKMTIEMLRIPRPKAGEVLLKVRACGVCHTDLHVIKAEQAFPTPCVLGHEVTGEVLEHGPNTDPGTIRRVPLGAKVVGAFIMPCGGCFFCTQGQEDLCATFFEFNRAKGGLYDGETRLFRASNGDPISMYSMGGLAEFCVLPATAVSPLPDSLPYAESSIMGCAVFTAYGAMRHAADMRAGQSVAVIGTGGVGSSCIQIARAFGGGEIIAVDVSDAKLEKARKFGATHTINSTKEDAVACIRAYTGGRGVDIAVEALGRPSTFAQGVLAVRDGGRAVMVGIAPTGVTAEIDIARIVRRNIKIVGSYGAKARQDLPALIGLAEKKLLDITSAVTEHHPLESVAETYKALDRGEIVGRAIVDMEL